MWLMFDVSKHISIPAKEQMATSEFSGLWSLAKWKYEAMI
jgi:hypothetical protein